MNRQSTLFGALLFLTAAAALAQDVMQYHVKHLTVLAEDDKVRVLRFAPHAGDKTPMHSHPESVVYVLKGGKLRYTFPDGTTKDAELKTGETMLRPPVTHADEALTDVESILIEIKK
jgi:quercetin dioxygenase-like cupin family protein